MQNLVLRIIVVASLLSLSASLAYSAPGDEEALPGSNYHRVFRVPENKILKVPIYPETAAITVQLQNQIAEIPSPSPRTRVLRLELNPQGNIIAPDLGDIGLFNLPGDDRDLLQELFKLSDLHMDTVKKVLGAGWQSRGGFQFKVDNNYDNWRYLPETNELVWFDTVAVEPLPFRNFPGTRLYSGIPIMDMVEHSKEAWRRIGPHARNMAKGVGRGFVFSQAGSYVGGSVAQMSGYERRDGERFGSFVGAEGGGVAYELYAINRSGQVLTTARTVGAVRNASAWMFYVNVGMEGLDVVGARPVLLGGKGLGKVGLSPTIDFVHDTTPTSVVGYVPAYANALNSPIRGLYHTLYGTFIGLPKDTFNWAYQSYRTRRLQAAMRR